MITVNDNTYIVDQPVLPDFLICRQSESHKGTYGHALLVAGSYGKMGAAVLAASACLRMGVGLLTVHVPRRGVDIMQVAVPEAMLSIDEDEFRFTHQFTAGELERYSAIGAGPALGTESGDALRVLLQASAGKPLVLDADALNMVAQMEDGLDLVRRHALSAHTILTPHAKEFERLFGKFDNSDLRLQFQRQISQKIGAAIVYKGHQSKITSQVGDLYINTTGNPGMATAGSGDVLTGIILSILAQNKDNQCNTAMCAVLGVWIHGKSGDIAVEKQQKYSLIASDIVKNLQFLFIDNE